MGNVSFKAGLGWLREAGNADHMRRGLRGVEKESLRVTRQGRLSERPHPESLGSALTHPYITTDYSEALLEFVTPPYASNWEVLQFLCDLHGFVHQRLDAEMLWAASMPCVMKPDQEIPIAYYGSSNLGRMKTVYRRGLGYRYGRAMQAIAGVHFNFSLPDSFWSAYRERLSSPADLLAFKSEQYMGMVRNYRRYAWLIIYLFGASPAFCKSFRPHGHEILAEFEPRTWYAPFGTSLRMSDLGYRNKTQARLNISANSLQEYVDGLRRAVTTLDPDYEAISGRADGEYCQLNTHTLQIENEYYSSIRPKPKKPIKHRPTIALSADGVEYVEIRTLDLNITDPVGINQNQLRVLEALLIFCLLADSPPIDDAEQSQINARELTVAREGRRPGLKLPRAHEEIALSEWGLELLAHVGEISALLDTQGEGYVAALEAQRAALRDPNQTPSSRLLESMHQSGSGFFEFALEVSRNHSEYLANLPLASDKAELFARVALESLEETALLEREQTQSFDEFLAEYFRRV